MKKVRMLCQLQLSNYDTFGNFILEADSGYQMVIGRCREMLRQNPDLDITLVGPECYTRVHKNSENSCTASSVCQVMTLPRDINPDLWQKYGDAGERRLHYVETRIIPNALATRYDFNWHALSNALNLCEHRNLKEHRYDIVYINDPMLLRAYKAMFQIVAGYQPKFVVHSHFVDVPSCPKFPLEASLWFGQLEAAFKADWNFWQCESAYKQFIEEASKYLKDDIVAQIAAKSDPWDDGYSVEETNTFNHTNVRFDVEQFARWKREGKTIIFVPNRIGGKGRSSDYTNCGKFMFDILPQLRQRRQDFVVIAGNPSQKILNQELERECSINGYVSLVDNAFTRDEYKVVAKNSDIVVGLYDQDTFGGTASRECIELGCVPLWISCNEYANLARQASCHDILASMDFSDLVTKAEALIDKVQSDKASVIELNMRLRTVVRDNCSYERTTPKAMIMMGAL